MGEILFLSAPLIERIWGGDYFKNVLKVTNEDKPIGEMWSASALEEAPSLIKYGKFKGKTLRELYQEHPEFFNYPTTSDFPLLIKIIATRDVLSVQVHPDDEYANRVEHQNGKTEGWLILDAKEDSSIVIGHHAKNKEELMQMIAKDDYEHFLCRQKVHRGEFYPIPAGTIHALGKNIVLVEIQQSSNVTYRFYDYHRKDKDGKERELHVKKAIDVTSYERYSFKTRNCFVQQQMTLWENDFFVVHLYAVEQEMIFNEVKDYLLVSIIEGEFRLKNHRLKIGDSFILCCGCKNIVIKGNGRLITTQYLKK